MAYRDCRVFPGQHHVAIVIAPVGHGPCNLRLMKSKQSYSISTRNCL